jgi:signal transduction histidine kinase/CHASE3 domain sensor protein
MTNLERRHWPEGVLTFFVGFGLATLILLLVAALAFVRFDNKFADKIRHINLTLDSIEDVRLPIRSAERYMFAYLLTEDPSALVEFDKAIPAIERAGISLTSTYISDGKPEIAQKLEAIIASRLATFRFFRESTNRDAVLRKLAETPMSKIAEYSAFYDSIRHDAENALREVTEQGAALRKVLILFIAFGIALSTIIVITTTFFVRRMERERGRAIKMLAASNTQLEETVTARTADLRQASEKAQRAANTLFNTIQSMADAIIVTDPAGTVILSNPKAAQMLEPLEAFGKPEWDEHQTATRADGVTPLPLAERPIPLALNGQESDDFSMMIRKKNDKKSVSLQITTRTIRDDKGSPEGIIAIFRDVTEIQETERQLRYSQKMDAIGQLTGGIAHDFNNILTVIIGTIGVLREGVEGNADLSEIARMIEEAAGRGADLTQHLLAFARKQPLQPRAVDVPTLVTTATKLLKPTLGEHIEITTSLDEPIPPALADPSQLTTAILNLAVNARDAMPRGGKIMIEADEVVFEAKQVKDNPDLKPGPYVMIALTDNGEGMRPEIRDRIFEPFFTTKPMGSGTGLGLAMVYGFVKQSSGYIQVYSEVGQGTSVKLFLPSAQEAAIVTEEQDADISLPTGNERILVVEDDKLVGDYVTRQLNLLGYQTCPAESAAAALKMLDDGEKFDLMLTDIILPGGMNGRELAKEVNLRRPEIKIVYTSGYSQDAIIHHGRLDPDVLLLSKPYRRSKLAQILRTALDVTES